MAADLKHHIEKISRSLDRWFKKENSDLQRAIEQTVDEKLFSYQDIRHQILSLKQTLTAAHLEKWVLQSDAAEISGGGKGVLCLHAGNLPMVGVQDLIAVMLRNGNYTGKLSRKDPYLMDSLLRNFAEDGLVKPGNWSTDMDQLTLEIADALLFAGSKKTAGIVRKKLLARGLISRNTPTLMRTAHYSIAYIPETSAATMHDVTEAIFRYGGAGCRSVAIVVSPFPLNAIKCEFTDYIEAFWLKNPPDYEPEESLAFRFATNKALDISQAWLDLFLIEESDDFSAEKNLVFWIQGDIETLKDIEKKGGSDVQSVYSTADFIGRKIGKKIIEPLSLAQNPPVWWTPDGTDTLCWLKKNGI